MENSDDVDHSENAGKIAVQPRSITTRSTAAEAPLAAFKEAFTACHARVLADIGQKNRDHIVAVPDDGSDTQVPIEREGLS